MLNFLKKTYLYFKLQRFAKKLHLVLPVIKTLNFLKIIFIGMVWQVLSMLNQLSHSFPSLRKWSVDLAKKTHLYYKLQRFKKKIKLELYLKKPRIFLFIIFTRLIVQVLSKLSQLSHSFPSLRKWLLNLNFLQKSYLMLRSFRRQQEIKFISFQNNAIDLKVMTPRSRQIYQDLKLAITLYGKRSK